jgi:hypothetical protein
MPQPERILRLQHHDHERAAIFQLILPWFTLFSVAFHYGKSAEKPFKEANPFGR